jgi:AcrR family transcriptional regulator
MATRQRQPTGERRRQIAAAALKILEERGATALTAAELARAVGIADATLFRHFRNMDEIVQAAIDHMHELFFAEFPPKEGEPLERLRSFFLSRLRLVEDRPNLLRLAFTNQLFEIAGQQGFAKLHALAERSRGFVVGCLREARERGEIGAQLSPEALFFVVIGALKTSSFSLLCPRSEGRLEAAEIWGTVESLLRSSAARRPE